jgi:hypothetical protein
MAIDASAVVAQFGAHYKPGSDNQKNLRNMIYRVIETAQYFQSRPTTDTIWRGNLASLNRVVQPFQKAYTPISTIKFEPNEFPLYKLKIDLEETPDDLEATYLGFLADLPEADRAKWPFVRWWLENHVMPKKDEDLELYEYFAGVYAAPAAGVAGAAGTAMNGIRKIIRGYNTAGRLNLKNGPIVTGAPNADPATFCSQVEAFVESIPSLFRKKIDFIFMSPDLALRYKKGKRAKYNVNYAQASDLETIENFPHIRVVGLESHSGSNLFWTTLADNRIRPQKKAALKDTMKLESAKRVVSAYTDWWEVLNFEVPEFVFTNDQDLV